MSLLPLLMDIELRPKNHYLSRLFDDLDTDYDILRPLLLRKHLRRRENIEDVGTTIKSDKDKFQVNLDVQHFAPEEISVKTADGFVVIEGKHEERKDDHGFVSRMFTRRYALPDDCNPESVESKLSSDGVLTVLAPKKALVKGERAVPITHTGPVRRKQADEVDPRPAEEEKSPQKKKRR